MKVTTFTFGNMKENCHVLWNGDGEAVIFDPGMTDKEENGRLFSFLSENALTPVAALVTHPHFDHICGADQLFQRYGIRCQVNITDRPVLESTEDCSSLFGKRRKTSNSISFFSPGHEAIIPGRIRIRIIPISGHTEGSLAYSCGNELFVGDTLTKGSLGFLETGYSLVLERIRDFLLPLPDETVIHYGHGEDSTIGEEKLRNRFFLRSAAL